MNKPIKKNGGTSMKKNAKFRNTLELIKSRRMEVQV